MDRCALWAFLSLSAVFLMVGSAAAFDVAECSDTVKVDGKGNDDAWDDANHGSFASGRIAYYACYDQKYLYFLVTAEDNTSTEDDLIQIWIDPDNSGDDSVEDDDFGFEINRDGDLTEYHGTDADDVENWKAKRDDNDDDWSAEFAIELGKLGISPGDDDEMAFAIRVENGDGTDYTGPGSADEDDPSTWVSLKPDEDTWGEESAPILTGGTATPVSVAAGTPGAYRFEVTYRQDDGEAPDSIKVFINGQQRTLLKSVSSCNVASGCKYSFTQDLTEGSYSFYFIAAYSGGTVRFPDGQNLQITIAEENSKPVVRISAPSDGARVKGTITVSGTASDPDGTSDLSLVEIRVDSGRWVPLSGKASWSYQYDTTNVEDGSHVIYARATDKKSAESDIESVNIVVDNKQLLTRATDSDDDGMPDLWELAYGLDPEDPADASRDSDGDGLTNLAEFTAGRNPEKADNPQTCPSCSSAFPSDSFFIGSGALLVLLLAGVIFVFLLVLVYDMGKGRGRDERPRSIVPKSKKADNDSDEITA